MQLVTYHAPQRFTSGLLHRHQKLLCSWLHILHLGSLHLWPVTNLALARAAFVACFTSCTGKVGIYLAPGKFTTEAYYNSCTRKLAMCLVKYLAPEKLAFINSVSSRLGFTMRRLENSLCQPSCEREQF